MVTATFATAGSEAAGARLVPRRPLSDSVVVGLLARTFAFPAGARRLAAALP